MTSGDDTRSALLRRLENLRAEVQQLEAQLHPGSGSLPSKIPRRGPSTRVATNADVSCRVVRPFMDRAEERGLDPAGLLRGLRVDLEYVREQDEWLTWDEFCVICRNIQRELTEDELEDVAHQLVRQPFLVELTPVAAMLSDAAALYEWIGHRLFGTSGLLFRCVRFELAVSQPSELSLGIRLPEGYRHNPSFYRLLAAWFEAVPRLVNAPPAEVSMQAIAGGARYRIRPACAPGSGTLRTGEAQGEAHAPQAVELLVRRNQELERQDVEREADFRALQESEKRFRILAELTNDYCFLARIEHGQLVCEWITGSHVRTTGYGSAELMLQGVHGIVHADDRDEVRQAVAAVARGEAVQHEYRILTRHGELRWVREHLRPEVFSDGDVGPVYGAVRDVTERHHAQLEQQALEEQLRQSQKMDAVGRLAGGIAHDFNNLLTVILTHVGFLLNELREDTQAHDDAIDIQQASRRAAGLTQRLLTFSRQQVITPTVLELNLVIRDLEPMLNSLVGEGIELDIRLDPRQSCVSMDRAQLEQILLNLVVNARDAMDAGGRVTIATGEVDLGEGFVRSHPEAHPGRHVALAVRDTGCGMDERTLGRIFEPFFSTKPPDKGTGLGLSTVYGIVRQAGGSIDVESQPGFGTTFELYFPVVEGAMTQDPSVRPKTLDAQNQETILVVEDEEGVRRGVQRILKHAGYEVLVAADPAQAITIVEEYAGHLDLLLTDVVMPMMNGVQLAERVTAMRTDIRVLYMSGYTSDSVETGTALDEEIAFLHKPFTRQAMLAKVAEVLHSQAPPDARQASC